MKHETGNLKSEKTDLKARTRELSLAFIRLYVALPKTTEAQILGKQVLRSTTSVGAHYRASQRAKSDADFIYKIEIALQEAEESLYWLELLEGSGILQKAAVTNLETVLEVCGRRVCLPAPCEGEGAGVRFGLRFDPIPDPSPYQGEGRTAFPKLILRAGTGRTHSHLRCHGL